MFNSEMIFTENFKQSVIAGGECIAQYSNFFAHYNLMT